MIEHPSVEGVLWVDLDAGKKPDDHDFDIEAKRCFADVGYMDANSVGIDIYVGPGQPEVSVQTSAFGSIGLGLALLDVGLEAHSDTERELALRLRGVLAELHKLVNGNDDTGGD